MARSTLVAVMGQLACYSGKEFTWEQVTKSNFVFTPKAEDVRLDMEPPVKPDAQRLVSRADAGIDGIQDLTWHCGGFHDDRIGNAHRQLAGPQRQLPARPSIRPSSTACRTSSSG